MGEVIDSVLPHLAITPQATPRSLIASAIGVIIGWLDEHPNLYLFLRERRSGSIETVESTLADRVAGLLQMLMMFFGIDSEDAEPGAYGIVGFVESAGAWWLVKRTMSRERFTESVCQAVWHLLEGTARANGVHVGYDDPLPSALFGATLTPEEPHDRIRRGRLRGTRGTARRRHRRRGGRDPGGPLRPDQRQVPWYGRVAASPEVARLVATGVRKVVLRTPFAEVETALSDVDPWGRPRVEGFGAAPFEVLDHLPESAQ